MSFCPVAGAFPPPTRGASEMAAQDWRPWDAAELLRKARDAATPTADFALIEAAMRAALVEIETVRHLAEDDSSRSEYLQRCLERLTFAGEHVARHADGEGDGNDVPL